MLIKFRLCFALYCKAFIYLFGLVACARLTSLSNANNKLYYFRFVFGKQQADEIHSHIVWIQLENEYSTNNLHSVTGFFCFFELFILNPSSLKWKLKQRWKKNKQKKKESKSPKMFELNFNFDSISFSFSSFINHFRISEDKSK